MTTQHNDSGAESAINWKKTLLISAAILVVAALLTLLIFSTEPTAQRVTATKQTAMLVDVSPAEKGDYRPTIVATGTVAPEQDVMLSPRVSGEVVMRSPDFTPGGYVQKGELLLQIDPADYENALLQAQSDLRQAQADLNVEMGRQEVAQRDFQLFDDTLSVGSKALVLREPQLNAARARVQAAEAAVKQAELNLQRTSIRAPFNAHILSRNANVGSQVAPGEPVGRLVGLDAYWVVTTVPLSQLRWIEFPDDENERGSEVLIRNRSAWPEGVYRSGYIDRLVGALEEPTRMARVLVEVPDPLGYKKDGEEKPALIIGSFVEARIKGRPISEVVRIDRDFVRKDETVWVMQEKQLRIRDVQIAFQDASWAYIENGLNQNDSVVITNLTTVVDGSPLRVKGEESGADTVSVSAAETAGGSR